MCGAWLSFFICICGALLSLWDFWQTLWAAHITNDRTGQTDTQRSGVGARANSCALCNINSLLGKINKNDCRPPRLVEASYNEWMAHASCWQNMFLIATNNNKKSGHNNSICHNNNANQSPSLGSYSKQKRRSTHEASSGNDTTSRYSTAERLSSQCQTASCIFIFPHFFDIYLPIIIPFNPYNTAQSIVHLKKIPFISVCITSERLGWLGNWKTLGCYTSLTHNSQLFSSSAVQLFSSWWRWRDGSSWFACNPFGYVLLRPSLSRHSNMTNSAQNVKKKKKTGKRKKKKHKMWTANCICNWGKWTF